MRLEIVGLLFFIAVVIAMEEKEAEAKEKEDLSKILDEVIPENFSKEEKRLAKIKLAKRVRDTIKMVKQLDVGPTGVIEKTIQTNFLSSLVAMANSSATTGAQVSRAAGTLIRGLIQDQFNLASIGAYLPRLIFLDGPTQFIEVLRLTRTGQIRIPTDIDSAIDTLINFAQLARESQITQNIATPFLSIFPNIFRGVELLNTEVIYGVFSWLAPLGPSDISFPAIEGLWNRWDMKTSTTTKPRIQGPLFTEMKPDDPKRISLG